MSYSCQLGTITLHHSLKDKHFMEDLNLDPKRYNTLLSWNTCFQTKLESDPATKWPLWSTFVRDPPCMALKQHSFLSAHQLALEPPSHSWK